MKQIKLKLIDILVRFIRINNPSKNQKNIHIILLAFEEIIIILNIVKVIIDTKLPFLNINENNAAIALYLMFAARIVNSLIFLIAQHPILYAFQYFNITITFILFYTVNKIQFVLLLLISLLFQIPMAIVQSLSQETRFNNNNLTERINNGPYIMRKLCIHIISAILLIQMEKNFLFTLLLLIGLRIYWLRGQKLTNIFLEKCLLNLQIMNLCLIFLSILYEKTVLPLNLYLIVLSLLILFVVIKITCSKISYENVYEIGKRMATQDKMQQCTVDQTLKYFLSLNYLTYTENKLQMINFLFYHRSICHNLGCPMWFNNSKNQNNEQFQMQNLKIIFKLHIEKQIFFQRNYNQQLKKFRITFLTPSFKVYQFLKDQTFHCRRQLYRLQNSQNQEQENSVIISAMTQYKKNNEFIQKNVATVLNTREKLYQQLSKKSNHIQEIISLSQQIIQAQQFLIHSNKAKRLLSESNRFKLNQLIYQFLPHSAASKDIENCEFILQNGSKDLICILICAEGDKFGKVINVNKEAVKWTYLSKNILKQVSINDLVPSQIREKHNQFIEKQLSRVANFQSYNLFTSTIFFYNALGYIVPGTARIYRLVNERGRYWNVVYQTNYNTDAILIFNFNGKLFGMNENCISYGFRLQMMDQIISKDVLQHLAKSSSKKAIKDFNQPLFIGNTYSIADDVQLRKVETHQKMYQYYVIMVSRASSQRQIQKKLNIEEALMPVTEKCNFKIKTQNRILANCPKNQQQMDQSLQVVYEEQQEDETPPVIIKENHEQINEMILYNNTIDHKRNIRAKQHLCKQILIEKYKQQSVVVNQISKQSYKEKLNNKIKANWSIKNNMFLLLNILLYVLAFVLLMVITGFQIAHSVQNKKETQIFLLFNTQFISYTRLGILPMNKQYRRDDITDEIKSIYDEIQKNWQDIENMQSHAKSLASVNIVPNKYTSQNFTGLFMKFEKSFNLVIRQYIQTGNQSLQVKIVSLLLQAIYPGYINIIEKVQDYYKNKQYHRSLLLIILKAILIIVYLILLICWFILFKKRLNRKKKIATVISKISETTLKEQMTKIYSLRNQYDLFQRALQSNDKEEQNIYSQNSQTTLEDKPIEHSIKLIETNKLYQNQPKSLYVTTWVNQALFFVFIFLSIFSINVGFYTLDRHTAQKDMLLRKMFKNTNTMIATSYIIWSGLNINVGLQNQYFQDMQLRMHQLDNQIQENYVKNIENKYLSQIQITFYENLMYGHLCQKFKVLDSCPTDFNGALTNGISQIYSYLMRNFQRIQKLQQTVGDIEIEQQKQNIIDNIIKANSFYLPSSVIMLKQWLMKIKQSCLRNELIIKIFLCLGQIVLTIILIVVTIKWIIRQQYQALILERTLNFFPFQTLINMAHFKKMILKQEQKKCLS